MGEMGAARGIYSLNGQLMKQTFPNLTADNYLITSPQTPEYNCIAWAAGDTEKWWWPDQNHSYHWPPNIPRTETLGSFISAYALQGYSICQSADYEEGFEKIAIYAKFQKPTHASRQLSSGHWTSKLGNEEDIEHFTLEGLCGDQYGTVAFIMKRQKNANTFKNANN
jgi:hypothetical protein